jgi:hypothetical protein
MLQDPWRAKHPAPAALDRLAHEYELRDELDPAWAARPLKLVRERGQTILLRLAHGFGSKRQGVRSN